MKWGITAAAIVFAAAGCVGALPGTTDDGGAGGGAGSAGGAGLAGAGASDPTTGRAAAGGAGGRATGPGTAGVPSSGTGAVGPTGGGGTAGSVGPPSSAPRLIIFYTRWGTAYPDWWPAGSEISFSLGPILAPLERYKDKLIVLSGLTNANFNVDTSGNAMLIPSAASEGGPDVATMTLLTGEFVMPGGTPHGPSLDNAVGDCGGTGPPLRLAIGQFGYDDNPGLSFDRNGVALPGIPDPNLVATAVLGHTVPAPDPRAGLDTTYPQLGAAHMDVAVEALALSKTCVVTLMWGDDFVPAFLGLTQRVHELSHTALDLYSATHLNGSPPPPMSPFAKLQTFYAMQFASLLDRLNDVPFGAGTLLDQSVVVWISETGAGPDHLGRYIPAVIAGSGGGRLATGRYLQIKPHAVPAGMFIDTDSIERTQGDLMSALAMLWRLPSFGDREIVQRPLTEILKP